MPWSGGLAIEVHSTTQHYLTPSLFPSPFLLLFFDESDFKAYTRKQTSLKTVKT
jgi:hypothetical protein